MNESRKREPWNPLLKSYPESEKINAVSIGAETMYTRLIAKADDRGNYYGDPSLILAYLFGHRFAAGNVSGTDTARWRDELETVGLLTRYEAGTQTYLHVVNPHRRLRNDVRPDEQFPREPDGANIVDKAIPEHGTNTGRTRPEHGTLDPDPDPDQDQDQDQDQEKICVTDKPDDLKEEGYSSDFEEFWAIFKEINRAEGKPSAWEHWNATLKGRKGPTGHPPIPASAIIISARNYRDYCIADNTERKYVMLPASFVGPKRRGWEGYMEPIKLVKTSQQEHDERDARDLKWAEEE